MSRVFLDERVIKGEGDEMKKMFNLFGVLIAVAAIGATGCSGSTVDCSGVENTCETAGATQCSTDNLAVETCAPNADGCLVWSTEACGSGMVCDASGDAPGCVVGCEHECDPNAFPACSSDGSAIEICVLQEDGCYDLVSNACDAGLACDDSGDEPVCSCTNECDPVDYPACSDNTEVPAIETCEQGDDGCFDLVVTNCGENMDCDDSGDEPVCVLQCENQCDPADYPACSVSGFAIDTCVMAESGCYELVSTDCDSGQACNPDTTACEASGCTDDCDPLNFPACSADSLAVETCERQADGCFDLVTAACEHGQACAPETATCESTGCNDDCAPDDYPVCSEDNLAVVSCQMQADGCYDVVSTACDANYACDADSVTCELTCTDDCDPADYPACSADGSAVESCEMQADGCYDVLSAPCDANYSCNADSVTCEPTCTDDCDPADYPVCSADNLAVETCEAQADGCYDVISSSCDFAQVCDDASSACVDDSSCEDRVSDGSFEGGTPNADWNEASTNFGTPICTEADCGNAGGTMLPRTGTYYVWMGGTDQIEDALVSQGVRIANGAQAHLNFYLHIPATISSDQEVFEVLMDSDVLFSINGTETDAYAADYVLVDVDVSSYADASSHLLTFHASTIGAVNNVVTNIALDDVSIVSCGGTCVNECDTLDELACSDDLTLLNVCQLNNSDGCNDWVLDTNCAANAQTCDDSVDPAVCVACQDECASDGLTRCNGAWIETCTVGADTCLDWVQTTDCTDVGYCDGSNDPAVCAPYNSMAPGDNCDDAALLPLDVPASLPAQDLSQTTCGRGNDYSDTCMGNYDGGEDIIYQLNVTEPVAINIFIDPKGTTYTGIGVGLGCPLSSDDCVLAGGVSSSSEPYMTGCFHLETGLYSVMIDTWAAPDCIPDFDIAVEQCECAAGETQCIDGMTAAVCSPTGQWENTACDDGCAQLPSGDFGCFYRPKVEGDLVITEIMQNPAAVSDSAGEWFEVINKSGHLANLNGLTVKDDGSNSFTIDSDVFVADGAYAVLGNNSDVSTNGGVVEDYSYAASDMSLGNGSDEIEILNGDIQIDKVAWDGGPAFPDPSGASMSLDPQYFNTTDNDSGSNWCVGQTAYGDGDMGTPGSGNLPCGLVFIENLDADPGLTMTGEWQWGVPDFVNYPAGPAGCANDSAGCLGTNLAGAYSNNLAFDSDYVQVGPIDLSAQSGAMLYFSMWLNTESNWDGARVEVSTDGSTFEMLPVQSPAYNWPDTLDSWTGDFGTEWLPVAADLTDWVGGDVYLRFSLSSDVSGTLPGMYVDDIMVGGN